MMGLAGVLQNTGALLRTPGDLPAVCVDGQLLSCHPPWLVKECSGLDPLGLSGAVFQFCPCLARSLLQQLPTAQRRAFGAKQWL